MVLRYLSTDIKPSKNIPDKLIGKNSIMVLTCLGAGLLLSENLPTSFEVLAASRN